MREIDKNPIEKCAKDRGDNSQKKIQNGPLTYQKLFSLTLIRKKKNKSIPVSFPIRWQKLKSITPPHCFCFCEETGTLTHWEWKCKLV